MNAKKSGRFAVLGASALLVGLGLTQIAACADNRASLYIRQVQLPTDDKCAYNNDPEAAQMASPGLLDIGLAARGGLDYSLLLLVSNQMVRRSDSTKLRSESDIVNLTYADVRLETLDGAVIDEFQVPIAGVVEPSSGTEPGFGVTNVPIVPLGTTQNHGGEMVDAGLIKAFVIVGGVTSGDSDIESAEWEFPIQVCDNCICDFDCTDEGAFCGLDPALISCPTTDPKCVSP
jgi:hypothetical protein